MQRQAFADCDRRPWTSPIAGLLVSLAVALSPTISAADTLLPQLRAEFAIAKEGRLIVLPVSIGDREFRCLVDTGASRSGFDERLAHLLGDSSGSCFLNTPAGRKRVKTYPWPEATLKGQSLKTDRPVALLDLQDIRRATNDQIFGVIGMDVLRFCCFQIDFERGIVKFQDPPPQNESAMGAGIPIESGGDGVPFISAMVTGDRQERFLIDTGGPGNSLETAVFDDLLDAGHVELGRNFASLTVGGGVQGDRGRLREISVGPFTQRGLRFSRLNVSALGLRYLSRFQVTFDFPGKMLYLQNAADDARPEPCATSGLVLNWIDGEAVVEAVRPNGPAAAAKLVRGDVLVRINGRPAGQYDPFALRQLLTSKGGVKVPATIRRENRELERVLVLEED